MPESELDGMHPLLILIVLTVLTAPVKKLAFAVTVGFILIYFAFEALSLLVRRGARRLPVSRQPALILARAALSAPTSMVRAVVQSLGIGLSLLVAVLTIKNALTAELANGLPKVAPNFFVLDVDRDEAGLFRETAERVAPGVVVEMAPMLRGRLVELAGKKVEEVRPTADSEWVLRGDRGLTFAANLPTNSRLIDGAWWPQDYSGPPLVSLEQGAAKDHVPWSGVEADFRRGRAGLLRSPRSWRDRAADHRRAC